MINYRNMIWCLRHGVGWERTEDVSEGKKTWQRGYAAY
jgi:hypothetical protein